MLVTVNVSSQGLISILTSIVSLQDPLQCLIRLFRVHIGKFLSYSKKGKISQNDHSLSLVVICCLSLLFKVTYCHSLSLVAILATPCLTRFHSVCHLLSFVVTRCHSLYHSLSLDVSLVCLFINNHFMVQKMFVEIRLCNLITYVFKGHLKIVKIYIVKFNVSILKGLK